MTSRSWRPFQGLCSLELICPQMFVLIVGNDKQSDLFPESATKPHIVHILVKRNLLYEVIRMMSTSNVYVGECSGCAKHDFLHYKIS